MLTLVCDEICQSVTEVDGVVLCHAKKEVELLLPPTMPMPSARPTINWAMTVRMYLCVGRIKQVALVRPGLYSHPWLRQHHIKDAVTLGR